MRGAALHCGAVTARAARRRPAAAPARGRAPRARKPDPVPPCAPAAAPQRANHSATLVERPGGGKELWVIGGQTNDCVMRDCWALDLGPPGARGGGGGAWRQVHVRCAAGGAAAAAAAAAAARRRHWQGGGRARRAPHAARRPRAPSRMRAPLPPPGPRSDDRALLLRTAHSAEAHPREPGQVIVFGGYGGVDGDYLFLDSLAALCTVTGQARSWFRVWGVGLRAAAQARRLQADTRPPAARPSRRPRGRRPRPRPPRRSRSCAPRACRRHRARTTPGRRWGTCATCSAGAGPRACCPRATPRCCARMTRSRRARRGAVLRGLLAARRGTLRLGARRHPGRAALDRAPTPPAAHVARARRGRRRAQQRARAAQLPPRGGV